MRNAVRVQPAANMTNDAMANSVIHFMERNATGALALLGLGVSLRKV